MIDVFSDLDDRNWELLARLGALDELNIQETQSDPSVYRHLSSIPSIRYLSIDGPYESTVEYLSSIEDIEELFLTWDIAHGQTFSGKNLDSLLKLKQLEALCFAYTSVDDSALATVGKLSKLEKLSLKGTPITDQGIAHLTGLKSLKELVLDETDVTENCFDDLAKLESLEILCVKRTKMTNDTTLPFSKLKHLPLRLIQISSAFRTADGKELELKSILPACEIDAGYIQPVFGEYQSPEKRARIARERARDLAEEEAAKLKDKENETENSNRASEDPFK